MQRDLNLLRSILLAVESADDGRSPNPILVDGYSEAAVGYHVLLAIEAGLLHGNDVTGLNGPPTAIASRLTWSGHEFLDAARDDSRWSDAMETAGRGARAVTLPVLIGLLTDIMKRQLGL